MIKLLFVTVLNLAALLCQGQDEILIRKIDSSIATLAKLETYKTVDEGVRKANGVPGRFDLPYRKEYYFSRKSPRLVSVIEYIYEGKTVTATAKYFFVGNSLVKVDYRQNVAGAEKLILVYFDKGKVIHSVFPKELSANVVNDVLKEYISEGKYLLQQAKYKM